MRRLILPLVITLSVGSLAPARADGGPGSYTTYSVPTSGAEPWGIAAGSDGRMWFTEINAGRIAAVSSSGEVTEYPLPTPNSFAWGVARGSDGNMWVTEADKIARVRPDGQMTEFTIGITPRDVALGPDGNMWFTLMYPNQVGRITPDGEVRTFNVPAANCNPWDIARGADGNMWFTCMDPANPSRVGRVTPGGTVTEFSTGVGGLGLYGIAGGPDGNMWISQSSGGRISRLTTAGLYTDFTLPVGNGNLPRDIAAGPDGNLWYARAAGNKVGRLTPTGTFTEYAMPANSIPTGLAFADDGSLWVTLPQTDQIAHIDSGVQAASRRPALAGTGQSGLPVVCAADVWGPTGTVTVAWQRNGTTIAGQTGLTYTPGTGDIGASITRTSTGLLPGLLTGLTARSNPLTVVAQITGPPGPPGPGGTLAAVLAPGAKTVKAGKTLKVQYGVTGATSLTAQLKGRKTLTKQLRAEAGTNTLRWKLPKNLKAGTYTLRLIFQGTSKAQTKVKVTK